MTRDQKAAVLRKACGLWFVLDHQVREDLIDGKCIYSEYQCIPIIDYTKKHPFFSMDERP